MGVCAFTCNSRVSSWDCRAAHRSARHPHLAPYELQRSYEAGAAVSLVDVCHADSARSPILRYHPRLPQSSVSWNTPPCRALESIIPVCLHNGETSKSPSGNRSPGFLRRDWTCLPVPAAQIAILVVLQYRQWGLVSISVRVRFAVHTRDRSLIALTERDRRSLAAHSSGVLPVEACQEVGILSGYARVLYAWCIAFVPQNWPCFAIVPPGNSFRAPLHDYTYDWDPIREWIPESRSPSPSTAMHLPRYVQLCLLHLHAT